MEPIDDQGKSYILNRTVDHDYNRNLCLYF